MSKGYEKLSRILSEIRKITDFKPKVALVLGSGLGEYADKIEIAATVNYSDVKGLPTSGVAGHKGRFVFGYVKGVPVVIMQGRVHSYEGYTTEEATVPIRLMKLMGAEKLILTNAAGGVNPEFAPGDLMIIEDHISCFVKSPLIGENISELGERFPDMSDLYSKNIRSAIEASAEKCGINIKRGVYIQLSGPNYETPAEIRMCRALGADAVGMSTACEAMVAKHMGMEIGGISCITNMAAGICANKLSHEEVGLVAGRVSDSFERLITELVIRIG